MGSVQIFRDHAHPYYRVSRCLYQSHASRKHTHCEWAVSLITGGSSLFRFGEQEHRIQQGQQVLIAPGFVHQCCPESVETWSFYMAFIEPQWLEAAGLNLTGCPCFTVRDLAPEAFHGLLHQYEALCLPDTPKEESLLYILSEALAETGPFQFSVPEDPVADSEALQRVCTHIQQHLAEPLLLEDLAQLGAMDRYRLIRSFSRRFNTTPHAWQLIQRMAEARRLLDAGTEIADTALAVGFYDQSHFTRFFKASFGMAPGQYVAGRSSK